MITIKYTGNLPHKHKVVIAGNHDLAFDEENSWGLEVLIQGGLESASQLLTHCIYLKDSMVNISGVNIYGTPW